MIALLLAASLFVKEASLETPCGSVILNVEVEPAPSFKLNMDAPWKLQVVNTQFDVPELKLVEHKVVLIAESKCHLATSWSTDYTLHAFTCTLDGSECRREVVKGTFKNK